MSDTDKHLRAFHAAAGELLSKLAKADASEARSYLTKATQKFYQTSDKNKEALNIFGQLRPVGQEIFAGDILAKFVHAIGLLDDITRIAIEENEKRKTTGRSGENAPHKADTALDKCLAILGSIYCQIWEKPRAGFARHADTRYADSGEVYANKGEAYGPFIRFAQCSLKVAGIDLDGNAIALILQKQRRAKKKKD